MNQRIITRIFWLLVVGMIVGGIAYRGWKQIERRRILEYNYEKDLQEEQIGIGRITTIADGVDVYKVNIWSSKDPLTRRINCSLKDGDKVDVMYASGEYYYIKTRLDACYGYCMKGFVILR